MSTIGHNSGVVDPVTLSDFRARADEFSGAADKWVEAGIKSADDAELCSDFVAGARKLWKEIDGKRKKLKEPHDKAGKAVQVAFAPLLTVVEKAAKKALDLHTAHLQAEKRAAEEKARLEREAAEREAAEARQRMESAAESGNAVAAEEAAQEADDAQARAAEAAKPVKAQARSASGGGRTIALRTVRSAAIVSQRQALVHFEKKYPGEFADLILRLANMEIRAAKGEEISIPGIEIVEQEKAA